MHNSSSSSIHLDSQLSQGHWFNDITMPANVVLRFRDLGVMDNGLRQGQFLSTSRHGIGPFGKWIVSKRLSGPFRRLRINDLGPLGCEGFPNSPEEGETKPSHEAPGYFDPYWRCVEPVVTRNYARIRFSRRAPLHLSPLSPNKKARKAHCGTIRTAFLLSRHTRLSGTVSYSTCDLPVGYAFILGSRKPLSALDIENAYCCDCAGCVRPKSTG